MADWMTHLTGHQSPKSNCGNTDEIIGLFARFLHRHE